MITRVPKGKFHESSPDCGKRLFTMSNFQESNLIMLGNQGIGMAF